VASGNTTTTVLADSLPTIIAAARIVREFEGVMPNLVDRITLEEGTGTKWNEISLAQLSASDIGENTELNNPQLLDDTLFSIEPTVVGIETILTDRVKGRISSKVMGRVGALGQNAIQRKKDDDGLAVLDGATTDLGSAGTTLTSGHVASGAYQITSNTTEPGRPPIHCVLHGFTIKAIWDELVKTPIATGTNMINEVTGKIYSEGFRGSINSAMVHEDGNFTIDSSDDVNAGVFAKDAIVLVQGFGPRTETERKQIGGGADALFMYDEYAYGERSAGNWLYGMIFDASAPTS